MSTTKTNHSNDSDILASSQEEGFISELEYGNNKPDIDVEFERKTVRHLDWRILPLLGLLYAVALIDRTNMGIARVAGMGVDLNLSVGNRFSIVSCIYFVPYIILELPSNLAIRWFGVRNLLTFLVVSWGAVQLGMGFVPTWGYLALCRVLLGTFEAGFFPAMVFIISTWYKRHEVQKRLAAFYLISVVLGGFSAIFAYALSRLGGKGGLAGWSYIFIIEGAITMALGIVAYFYIPEFPHKNKFLTPEETALVLLRIEEDRGDSLPDDFSVNKVLGHLSDWHIWAYGAMLMCSSMPAYSVSFFVTIILSSMGWDVQHSLLLSAPPYIFAALSLMFFAWLSDKYRHRAGFIAFQSFMTLIGVCMTGFLTNDGARYAGLFLVNAGASGCIPGVLAYSANNIVTHSKRAVTTAITVSMAGIGGVLATTVFRQQDFPRYLPGIITTILSQGLLLSVLAVTTLDLSRRNAKARREAGGQEPAFLYTL